MPALDQGTSSMLLQGMAGISPFVPTVLPLKCRVTMNAGTATVPGTEISGPGYTPGGNAVTFGNLTLTASGSMLLNTTALSWTNGGSAAWTVVGLELYDSSGTPVRKAFGLVNGQPLIFGPGSILSFAALSLGWAFP